MYRWRLADSSQCLIDRIASRVNGSRLGSKPTGDDRSRVFHFRFRFRYTLLPVSRSLDGATRPVGVPLPPKEKKTSKAGAVTAGLVATRTRQHLYNNRCSSDRSRRLSHTPPAGGVACAVLSYVTRECASRLGFFDVASVQATDHSHR